MNHTAPASLSCQQHEYCVLLRHYASVQARCSQVLAAQAAEIARLQREQFLLRAALVLRDTRLSWMQQDLAAAHAATPGLPKRRALAARVEQLVQRVQELMREKLQWQRAQSTQCAAPLSTSHRKPPTTYDAAATANDLATWERSLLAADLVICQAGCISHDDYWRVQDHCKRTGKQCILVEQPDALRIVRIQKSPDLDVPTPCAAPPKHLRETHHADIAELRQ